MDIYNVNYVRYADDTALIAETEEELQHIQIKLQKRMSPWDCHECKENILNDGIKEADDTKMYTLSKWNRDKASFKIQLSNI